MYLTRTHRSLARRLRLVLDKELGAGNFFWHAYRIAPDPEKPILYHRRDTGTTSYSLSGLETLVLRCADWHRRHGAGPGTRVGVYTGNGLMGLIQHIAITSIGGTTVLANAKMEPRLAAGYFAQTDTRLLVGDDDLVRRCQREWPATGQAPAATGDATAIAASGERPPDRPSYRHQPDDLVLISHSSGTTGVPKAASFTHQGFFIGKRERLWNFPSRQTDRLLTALPHSHSSGISYLSLALLLGLPAMLVDDRGGPSVAAAMNEFLPTLVLGFPLSLAELPVAVLSDAAAATVHTWMGMGDASHERHIRPLVALGATYVDGLGSSEMGMVLFKVAHTSGSSNYGRMVGKPVKVVRTAAVLDEEGSELPPGRAGLLGVEAPSVTPGYVNAPELTSSFQRGRYFLTGDVVRRDDDGNFFHLDRTPDVITTAAGPVHSLPVEEVVLLATRALDAAVFAVADPGSAASLPAAVVLFGGSGDAPAAAPERPEAAELLDRCNQALADRGLARLAALIVAADRTDLPVGVTGKVLKRELRERHADLLSRPPGPRTALDADRGLTGPVQR